MQKHANLVDLVKGLPTNIYLQNLASIQKTTSLVKFAHSAEKSEKGSISNLSTKVATAAGVEALAAGCRSRKAGPTHFLNQISRLLSLNLSESATSSSD